MIPSPDADRAPRHIPALDGVRGIAVLAVMVLHFTILTPAAGAGALAVDIIGIGWAGVDLFFVLSGFLITGILLDTKGRRSYYRNFYARRALRIFPLFYAYLALILVLWPMLSGAPGDSLTSKLLTATYLGNFLMAFGGWDALPGHTTHLWSLAVEEQFYLIWPFVVYALSSRQLRSLSIGIIVGAWVLRGLFHVVWPTGIPGYVLLPARADTLAAGALLALLVRTDGWRESLRPWVGRLAMIGAALIASSVYFDPVRGDGAFTPLHLHVQLLTYPGVMALSVAFVMWAVLPARNGRHRLVESAALQQLGQISYGMYLLHIPLRNLVIHRVFPGAQLPTLLGSVWVTQLLVVLAGIAITFVVASASWALFESPILRLKRYFEPEPVTVAATQRA